MILSGHLRGAIPAPYHVNDYRNYVDVSVLAVAPMKLDRVERA